MAPLADPQLADAVVRLRPWRDEDVPVVFRAFGDPVVQRFSWPSAAPYTEADARAFHEEQRRAWRAGTGAELACVEPQDEHALLGGASVFGIDRANRRASIGYWLAAHAGAAWRRTRSAC